MTLKYLLALQFLFLFFFAHAESGDLFPKPQSLVNKTQTQRTLQLMKFYEEGIRFGDSITIFQFIKKAEDLAKSNNDHELELETEFMRVHYYVYRDYFNEEFVTAEIEKLDKKAKNEKMKWLKIRTQSLLGNYLFYFRNNYGRGFEHLLKCARLLEDCSPDEYPLKQICLYQVGSIYYNFREYEDAKTYLLKALQASSVHDRYYYKMNILNTLGLYYRMKNDYDTSNEYFNKTLSNAENTNDTIWMCIIHQELAGTRYEQGAYKEAILLAKKSMNLCSGDKELTIRNLLLLGKIHLALNEIRNAVNISKQLDTLYRESWIPDYNGRYYFFRSKLAAYNGEPVVSSVYLDSALTFSDSLDRTFNAKTLLKARQRLDYEQEKLEEQKKESEHRQKIWLRNSIIILLVFSLMILVLLYNRHKLKAKNREQLIHAQKLQAEKSLEQAVVRLEDFQKSIHDKNKMIERFKKELDKANKEMINHSGESGNLSLEAKKVIIEQLQEAAILTDKDWREFVELFEMVHSGFFERLKEKYPDLTTSETRLLALSRLNLGNKEMAIMLGVGTGAIRQNKLRIRKKTGMDQFADIESFVSSI